MRTLSLSKIPKLYIIAGKFILFGLCLYYAVSRLPKVSEVELNFQMSYFAAVLLLFPLNWFLEYLKWRNIQEQLGYPVSGKVAFHSFLSGLVSGMLTPNMQGNFIGRMFYFKRRDRVSIIGYTLLSNFSQLLVTLIFGLFAVWYLKKLPIMMPVEFILIPITLLTILAFGFYFLSFRLASKFAKISFLRWLRMLPIKGGAKFLWMNLFWSALRFLVFSLQFMFMLQAFSTSVSLDILVWIWQFYFWVTLAPSMFLGKLAVRESVAVWVLGIAGCATAPVLIASFGIWLVNLFLPTIVGLIVLRIPNDSRILTK